MFIQRILLVLFSCGVLIGTGGVSQSYVYRGSPDCPNGSVQQHSWRQYLTGGYAEKRPYFSVRFNRSTHDIGTIHRGNIYTVTRHDGGWEATGTNVFGDTKTAAYGWGDPANYQLNVWGVQLLFNERGDVLMNNSNKEAVGTLLCGLGPDATQ